MARPRKTQSQPPTPTATPDPGRGNARGAASRNLILDTAEKLILEEGYAAVSSRRVAREAGLKAPLVHYHFPTTDELYVAVYRRAVERQFEKQQQALDQPASLRELWQTYCRQEQTALGLEFIALANHRKSIRDEVATLTERMRRKRADALARRLESTALPEGYSAAGLAVLMIGVARTLVMERNLGISLGHDDASRMMEDWLEQFKSSPVART